jgi:hypothetical protein
VRGGAARRGDASPRAAAQIRDDYEGARAHVAVREAVAVAACLLMLV